jgi:hypothetical protein
METRASYFSFGCVVPVVREEDLDAGELAGVELFELRRREGDAVRALRVAGDAQVLQVGAPAAADVEHELVGVHLGVLVEHPGLVDLGLLQGLVLALVDRAGVVHPLVEPEPEELVGDVVADLDLVLR